MTPSQIVVLGRELLVTALLLAAPAVLTSLAVGLIISVLQTLTSIQEQTLSFVPRFIAVSFALILTLPWMMRVASNFAVRMIVLASESGL